MTPSRSRMLGDLASAGAARDDHDLVARQRPGRVELAACRTEKPQPPASASADRAGSARPLRQRRAMAACGGGASVRRRRRRHRRAGGPRSGTRGARRRLEPIRASDIVRGTRRRICALASEHRAAVLVIAAGGSTAGRADTLAAEYGEKPCAVADASAHTRRKTSEALVPPKPKEFDSATSIVACAWPVRHEVDRPSRRTGLSRLSVGGAMPSRMARIEKIASTAPAAPSRWPIADLVEDIDDAWRRHRRAAARPRPARSRRRAASRCRGR